MKIAQSLRNLVFQRAHYLCEYYLIHEVDSYLPLQVEHIISQKHYKWHDLENLASACFLCNRMKGSDIFTILPPDLSPIRLYNPRTDIWTEHFSIESTMIISKTKIGQATINILQLNSEERLIERTLLLSKNAFPHQNVSALWDSQHSKP